MLTTDADTALVHLKRFKLFIDGSPVITEIIQERIYDKEYDFKECFRMNEEFDEYYIKTPINEDFHLKAQYDFITYLCDLDTDLRGIAFEFIRTGGSYTELVREFFKKAFKTLVDFLVDSLGKKIMALEGEKSVGNNITQHINTNYGNINTAGRDATINSTNFTNDVAQIKELIDKLKPTIEELELTDDQKEYLADDLETISEQIESPSPKIPRLKKAYDSVRNFVNGAATGVSSATLLLADWNKFVVMVEELIKTYSLK